KVDVLILVDREGAKALAHCGERMRILVEHPNRSLDQILEVVVAALRLAALVLAEHARHQIRRDRRRVLAELPTIALRRQAPVLRPLHLSREITGRTESVRPR